VQPLLTPARTLYTPTLTAARVVELIRDTTSVRFSGGCELLTGLDLGLAEDFTDDLDTGSVSRGSFANLHATAELTVTRELPFASAIVRPYLRLTDGVDTARFNLGAYFTSTPARDVSRTPVSYSVQCYDLLSILDDPVGDSYAVAEGTSYLEAIESILESRGVVRFLIDQTAADKVLPTDRTWMFADNVTWLLIVNDLLSSIGYQGIWTDWDGFMRCENYVRPKLRGFEWTYDTGLQTSMLGDRSSERDFYSIPNRWVFYQQNRPDSAPVEGDGIYTFVNESEGDTSVDGRGRQITKVTAVDAADHASLVSRAQITIDADMLVSLKIKATTFPNPLNWHFDVVRVEDDMIGPAFNALVTQWTLPLDGGDMTQEWTVI
jgi:hypothetical protein